MQPLLVRLSDAERDILDALVTAGCGSRAAIIRDALLALAGQAAARDPDRNRALTELADEMATIGVSLTHIARRLNAGADAEAAVLGAVLPSLIALVDATRREVRAATAGSPSSSSHSPPRLRLSGERAS